MFMVIWGFSVSEHNAKLCENLFIEINQANGNTFISNQDIEISLRQEGLHPVGKKINDIDLNEIEEKLEMVAEVKKASVFKNLNGNVSVHIEQRTPIVRVINASGLQFYIDEEGFQMPLSDNYTPRVPVVTGYINDPLTQYSINEIEENKTLAQTVKSDEVFKMVKYINKNQFWKAQIQQINFNQNNDIELTPTLGSHLIIFGDLLYMEQKFNKLKIFYTEGLNHLDWNIYDTINVKFKNQIICTKK